MEMSALDGASLFRQAEQVWLTHQDYSPCGLVLPVRAEPGAELKKASGKSLQLITETLSMTFLVTGRFESISDARNTTSTVYTYRGVSNYVGYANARPQHSRNHVI